MTSVLIKRVNWDTEAHRDRMPYGEEGRNLGDSSIHQGKQRLPANHQKLDSFSQPSKGTDPDNTLISGL